MENFFKKIFGIKKKEENRPFFSIGVPDDIQSKTAEAKSNKDELLESQNSVTEDSIISLKENSIQSTAIKYALESLPDFSEYSHPTMSVFMEQNERITAIFKKIPDEYKLPVLWSADEGKTVFKDLVEVKNIIVAGTQATGKTNFLHQIIFSLLLKNNPSQLKFVLIDCKGLEFNVYKKVEKYFLAKLPNEESAILKEKSKVVAHLNALIVEMNYRYELLSEFGLRNILEYNTNLDVESQNNLSRQQNLCSIILVIDDLGGYTYDGQADIIEPLVKIISQGYKVGIYSIIGTSQTGSVLPNNLLSMITYRVLFSLNSKEEYRKFLDTTRVNLPLAPGHFLYKENGLLEYGQSLLFAINSIENLGDFIGEQKLNITPFLLPADLDSIKLGSSFNTNEMDPLFEDAARIIVTTQSGSTSLLQRRMKLGYNRAGRLMDQLESAGIVGPNQGSAVRNVLIKTDRDLQNYLDDIF